VEAANLAAVQGRTSTAIVILGLDFKANGTAAGTIELSVIELATIVINSHAFLKKYRGCFPNQLIVIPVQAELEVRHILTSIMTPFSIKS
jgi:hypothetical protein